MAVFTDADIKTIMARQPAATLPATMAIARVQAPNYRSRTARGFGDGRYSIVTVRDVEKEEDFQRLEALPQLDDVASLNRLLVGENLESDRPLRRAAASLHADFLLLYTFDTGFYVDDAVRPLTVLTLGLSPHKRVDVVTTASAVLLDVRTGFVHGTCETTARHSQIASAWTDGDAVDRSRLKTERDAFDNLLRDFEELWRRIAGSNIQEASASIQ